MSDGRPKGKGGVKAQTQRGAMGKSWWAQRFLESLTRLDDLSARLLRGRSAARGGQVLALALEGGTVRATVQGADPEPYAVTVEMPPFDDGSWEEVGAALRESPLLAARLLAGELPEELLAVFEAAEAPLFPRRRAELVTACSCPEWTNPCQHIAAVFFLMAEELDRDPFLLLAMRGGSRQRLLAMLGADEPQEAPAAPLELPADPEAFWGRGPVVELAPAVAPPVDAALLRRLGPFPFWQGEAPVLDALAPCYRRATEAALGQPDDDGG
jgi:uncharacterized Zn finger protein